MGAAVAAHPEGTGGIRVVVQHKNGLCPLDVRTRLWTIIPRSPEIEVTCPPGQHLNFLESHIEIEIEENCIFTKLYDKRKEQLDSENTATFPYY